MTATRRLRGDDPTAAARIAARWLGTPGRLWWTRDAAGLLGAVGGTNLFMLIGRADGPDRLVSSLPDVGPRLVRGDDEAKVCAEWDLQLWLARLFHLDPPPALADVYAAANLGDPLPTEGP